MAKKEKITQNKENFIDYNTGDIVKQNITQSIPVGAEPNYYKVYLQDLANLQGLNPIER